MHHHNVDELNLKKIVRNFKKIKLNSNIIQKEDLQNILSNLKKANKIPDENLFSSASNTKISIYNQMDH